MQIRQIVPNGETFSQVPVPVQQDCYLTMLHCE